MPVLHRPQRPPGPQPRLTPKSKHCRPTSPSGANRPREEKGDYPIDQSDGGEDDDLGEHRDWAAKLIGLGRNPRAPWKSQIDVLTIDPKVDLISDSGEEIWSVLEQRKIKNVVLMGVHLNMCVLGRPFGLRQMAKNGKNVVLMRDMTDTMYNPERAPKVSHFTGTDLMIEHVEVRRPPSRATTIGGQPFRFSTDSGYVAFVIAEDEYKTEVMLPVFAAKSLARARRQRARRQGGPTPARGRLNDADVMVVSVRRRVLPKAQLDVIRKFVASGKGVVGIRTASHAFSLRTLGGIPAGHDAWPEFDAQVLGGHYTNHHGEGQKVVVSLAPDASKPPIRNGVEASTLVGTGSL